MRDQLWPGGESAGVSEAPKRQAFEVGVMWTGDTGGKLSDQSLRH